MMVTYVRGHFKDVHGTLDFDPDGPAGSSVEVVIDARKLWTGEPARDAHLSSADFLDVEEFSRDNFPRQQGRCDRGSRLSGDRYAYDSWSVTAGPRWRFTYLGNG